MKKHVISLAVSMAFAAPAFAQSSVTLYGVIDEGFNYTNNVGGKHIYELQSGYAQGSRWGLKGTEDLGGGLKALFQLENGFNVNNGALGQGGLMFGRQAYVGLQQDQYGTVTFGRQYDSVVDFLAPTTANGNWAGYFFSHPFDNDNTDNSFRVNNTVKYTSPDFAGLQFGGTYSFSNATNFAANRQYGFGGQYANGGLLVAAAYLQASNPSTTAGGAINNGGDANFVASRLRIFGGGINYTFGPATAGFVYTNTDLKNPTKNLGYLNSTESILPTTGPLAGGALNRLRYQNFEVNGKYQFTPAFFLGAQYVYTLENYDATTGSVKPKIHSVGLMADYNLSKRTDVYVQGLYQKVAGDKTGSSLDRAYITGAADLSSSSKQFAFRVAIRHKF
jgi:predicted porin